MPISKCHTKIKFVSSTPSRISSTILVLTKMALESQLIRMILSMYVVLISLVNQFTNINTQNYDSTVYIVSIAEVIA